jgi:cell migration-inducing and hyaluronan-binding protein
MSKPSLVEHSSKISLFFLALLLVAMLFTGRAMALTCDDTKNMPLQPNDVSSGLTTDLEVTGPCEVKGSASSPSLTYSFHSVNIYTAPGAATGGSLNFDDALTDFYAENIVVEKGGALIAGSKTMPIGMSGGLVTIHLWGAPGDPGVTCKSPNCGISSPPMGTNTRTMDPSTCTSSALPGDVNDCFYDYDALDPSDRTAGNTGAFFGHKVLALSYGGSLQLFGAKGATYTATAATGCMENSSSCTGTSWVRLSKNALPGDTELQVVGALDGTGGWQDKDNILLTTTDYLPGHSEQLTISGTPTVSGNVTTIKLASGSAVKYPHNGQTFDLSDKTFPGISRLGPNFPASGEMRAAVGLLTRSIRIISDGNTPGAPFAVAPGNPDNYFGGHTIVRQGFLSYQVQGAEFYELGQGGAIMHYPVHFHMARQTLPAGAPQPVTFVKDSSVWDSMTRFIVIHATQGVRLARNVGYESIGHGYYLEDGTETGNQLYANLGVFARGAVANGLTPDKANPQNPRMVPGILTVTAPPQKPPPVPPCAKGTPQNCISGFTDTPFYSDSQNPSVFWIMNGMNDFQYNMAAGAGTCGACYWLLPGAISGPSQTEKWFGYAGEQQGIGRAGTTPLQNFVGNSCSSAMEGFVEVGNLAACNGVNQTDPAFLKSQNSTLVMLPSPQAPAMSDTSYWPNISGLRLPTRCSDADQGKPNPECSTVKICASSDETNCDVVVLNGFTTAFNWAEGNFAAVWLRSLWSLAVNSVISDPQNAGINLVTSGGYDAASVFPGYWGLVRHTALIGSSQWENSNNSALAKNPYASNAGPFNPFKATIGTGDNSEIKGLTCAVDPFNGNSNNAYCLSQNDGVSFQVSNFFGFQRLFSVYDGPIFEDSNAFLDIHPTFLTSDGTATGKVLDTKGGKCEPNDSGNPCQFAGFISAGVAGLKAYRPLKNSKPDPAANRCYEPNAAIGWKQPNGFYYAPAFHSTNLFFSGVDIRHFVTDPFFMGGPLSFKTNETETKNEYCTFNPATFQGFTDIDRETVLNDDDGTLTGLTSPVGLPIPTATATPASRVNDTISVNKADFFKAPTEAWECASDFPARQSASAPRCLPATAKTSPYEYVSTVIYPECAKEAPPPPLNGSPSFCPGQTDWGSVCTSSPPNFGCPGVQLYRQLLTAGEKEDSVKQLKRMMGQNNFQRSALTVNHGEYYVNTTVSMASQTNGGFQSPNVFAGGNVYDLFFLFSKPDTQQSYKLFVGKDLPQTIAQTNVVFGYEGLTLPFNFTAAPANDAKSGAWNSSYNPKSGILTLTTKLSQIASIYNLSTAVANESVSLGQKYCQPATMCSWNQGANRCQCNQSGPYASLCNQTNPAGQTVCDWSIQPESLNCSDPNGCPPRFIDCPAPGCPAFQVTFPPACGPNENRENNKCFVADDSQQRPKASPFNFANPNDPFNWDVNYNLESATLAGQQCFYTKQPDTTGTCPTVDLK